MINYYYCFSSSERWIFGYDYADRRIQIAWLKGITKLKEDNGTRTLQRDLADYPALNRKMYKVPIKFLKLHGVKID